MSPGFPQDQFSNSIKMGEGNVGVELKTSSKMQIFISLKYHQKVCNGWRLSWEVNL